MTEIEGKTTPKCGLEAKELLLADLEHFGESFWRNEEMGEKRLSFFVALVTAVAGGLFALSTSARALPEEDLRNIAGAAAAGLLVIGLMSYLRMVRRNLVTDGFLRTLRRIRETYKELYPGLDDYRVPLSVESAAEGWPRGGYVETVAVLDGALVAVLSWLFLRTPVAWAAIAGVLSAAALWAGAAHARAAPGRPTRYFRAGVGAVIVNEQGLVLALERAGVEGAWQLPQGGLEEEDKDPEAAVFREIKEETGISRSALTPWARYPELLAYELPPRAQKPKTGIGQVHHWFFFKYTGPSNLELPPDGEFREASWRPFERIATEAVEFRKPAYRHLSVFLTELQGRSQPTAPPPS